jgi:15-cis-phytoene synthase
MPFFRDQIETSYRFCRQVSRGAGSSFHAGFWLLPRGKRRAMEALYAFMRHTDDLADDPPEGRSQRDALAAWRAELEEALGMKGEGGRRKAEEVACGQWPATSESEISDLRSETPDPHSAFPLPPSPFRLSPSAILPALAHAVRRFHIPHEHLLAVIDGVEMDLDCRRYETFDQLQPYCERVASAVGLACIHVWGFRGSEAIAAARKAGIALQLTNILRDLKSDADAGRIYLPLADLRKCGYSPDDLAAGVVNGAFRRLMALEFARAEQFYTEGKELMDWLDPVGRPIFGLMMATYRSLLRELARHPEDVLCRQMRLSGFKKLRLVARWSLLRPRKDAI